MWMCWLPMSSELGKDVRIARLLAAGCGAY